MPVQANQLNLSNISSDSNQVFKQIQNDLLSMLNQFIDIKDFIPFSFHQKYYSVFGRKRKFSLKSMIYSFILKNILSLPTVDLLINMLHISCEMRAFCGFTSVPNKSQFSRFKSTFLANLNDLFHNMVDLTEDLCGSTNSFLASILITDTTGFEAYVTENNPKFYQSELRKCKAYSKILSKKDPKSTFDAEKFAQSKMPKAAASNTDAKLAYLNGHFGYYQKCILSTNALGVVRDINFFDSTNSLELDLTPQGIKDSFDSKSLIPALETFFQVHPNSSFKYFLGDSGFDADDNYAYLHSKNIMPIININPRNSSGLPQPNFNNLGVPLCANDNSLPMIYDGIIRGKGRADRIKYICPKTKKTRINGKNTYVLSCDNPCTSSKCGRIKNITIHNNYRFNSSMPRDSLKWQKLYKLRTICERSISQLKNFIQIKSSKVRNTISLKSDVLLACISQLVSFILMCKSQKTSTPLAIKSLIA